MNNEEIIKNICQNIAEEAGKIVSISNTIKMYVEGGQVALAKDFDDIRINELEQMQKLTLMLTSCVMQNALPETNEQFNERLQNDEGEAIFGDMELVNAREVEEENGNTEAE